MKHLRKQGNVASSSLNPSRKGVAASLNRSVRNPKDYSKWLNYIATLLSDYF
jgi:hypothetical protein